MTMITTSGLSIYSCHYATFSQFVQEMYSIYSKSLLFTSIYYVQESFKLNEVDYGEKYYFVMVIFLWPIVLLDFR